MEVVLSAILYSINMMQRANTVVSDPYCLILQSVLQWDLNEAGVEVTIRRVDSYLWAVHVTVSWALPRPLFKETGETVIDHLNEGLITSHRKVGLVGI